MNAREGKSSVPAGVTKAVGDHSVIALIDTWKSRVNEYRNSGSPDVLGGVEKQIAAEWSREDLPELERLVLEAALGDCLSIRGRWNGNEVLLTVGVVMVWKLYEHICTNEDQFPETAFDRVSVWLGNAMTRLGYLTQDSQPILDARVFSWNVRSLEGLELASALRDAGDMHVGVLFWSPRVRLTGEATDALNAAEEIYERAQADGENVEAELYSIRANRAVASMFTLERLKTPRRTVSARYLADDIEETLLNMAVADVERTWQRFTELKGVGVERPHLWQRVLSHLGFAAHLIWRKTGEKQWWEFANRAFKAACQEYVADTQVFRLAIAQSGWADLYRDGMVRATNLDLRKSRFHEAERHAKAACSQFKSCNDGRGTKSGERRIADCEAMISWLSERVERLDLTDVPDLWQFVNSRGEPEVARAKSTSSGLQPLRDYTKASPDEVLAALPEDWPEGLRARARELMQQTQQAFPAPARDLSAATLDDLVATLDGGASVPPEGLVGRLQVLVEGAQASAPPDRADFREKVNKLLDGYSVRFKLDGGALTRLKFAGGLLRFSQSRGRYHAFSSKFSITPILLKGGALREAPEVE